MKKKRTRKLPPGKSDIRKLLLTMKLSCLLLLVSALSANAGAFSQSARVSVSLPETPLEKVFEELGRQAGVVFLYDHELVNSKGTVAVTAQDKELGALLGEMLPSLGLTYKVEDNVIVIREAARQQPVRATRVITGSVTDENGNPLPGVNVVIKGSTRGVATDIQGQFSLTVDNKPDLTLVVSFIGQETREVKLSENENYKIALRPRLERLDDIVVTGYQTISRERSAGAFSRVSGEDVARKANLTGNILETLEGLAPGLSVNFGSGEDKFLIRGTTSVNLKNMPLIVVDGVVMDIVNEQNPQNLDDLINSIDVENVTFLKDATAASIWGSRAANGVIVIETKKGKPGDRRVRITYDGSYTYKGLPDWDYKGLMNSEQFIQAAYDTFDPVNNKWSTVTALNSNAIVYPHELPMYQFDNGTITEAERNEAMRKLASQNNRSQIEEYLMQPAMFTKHSLSFTGGVEHLFVLRLGGIRAQPRHPAQQQ